MTWVERDPKDHQLCCYKQGSQSLDQVLYEIAQDALPSGLKHLQGWGIHNLSGQPVPVRHHPLCEKLPPNI